MVPAILADMMRIDEPVLRKQWTTTSMRGLPLRPMMMKRSSSLE